MSEDTCDKMAKAIENTFGTAETIASLRTENEKLTAELKEKTEALGKLLEGSDPQYRPNGKPGDIELTPMKCVYCSGKGRKSE